MQVIGDRLHPAIVQQGVDLNSLRLLYQNEQEREKLITELKANPNFIKAMDFQDRAILLSPNNRDYYLNAIGIHHYLRDAEALSLRLQRIATSNLDVSGIREDLRSFLAGETLDSLRENQQLGLDHQERLLANFTDEIIINQVNLRLGNFLIGDPVNHDQEIALLLKAREITPSIQVTSSLKNALAQKACLDLAGTNPEFKKLLESIRMITDAETVLILALTSDDLRPSVIANPAAQEAFQIFQEINELFPSRVEATDVVFTQYLKPDELAEIRNRYRNDPTTGIQATINETMSYWHPSTIISLSLHHLANDNKGSADTWLGRAKEGGLILPD